MSRHKHNGIPKSQFKSWIRGRHLDVLRSGLGQAPSDREVVDLICEKTGWERPGKNAVPEFFARYWAQIRGEPHGPIRKPRRREFYQSDPWRDVRYRALVLHGAQCQCCGRTPRHGVVLHVDHIKPRSKYPELELDISNLQVLCEDCNLGKLARDETDWRPVVATQADEEMRSLN